MKKITTLFFLLLFSILIFRQNNNKVTTVSANINNKNDYQKLYLKFGDDILTTKNFKIYFNSDIMIISVFSKINDCQEYNNRYLFKSKNLDNNLEGYYNYYINHFISNTKNYFQGAPIYIVEIDLSDIQLNKIMAKNKSITYSEELCGNYHRL